MISSIDWEDEYKKEIERAILARSGGNEGMARVCARRAAGIVVGEYLRRRGYWELNNSAYDRLRLFNSLSDVEQKYKEVSRHFLMKVNTDHNLPMNTDLIGEAIWLKDTLIGDDKD